MEIGYDKDDGVAFLCRKGVKCDYINSFLDVWVADDDTSSPIKSLEDAILFVEIIKKLLEAVYDDNG